MLLRIFTLLHRIKYEILLFALLQHTFTGIFLDHVSNYDQVWPINMAILIFCCFNVAWNENITNRIILSILAFGVITLPFLSQILGFTATFVEILSILYAVFFLYILFKLLKFLLKPSYINSDIISASICGYMVLIEVMTFLTLAILNISPSALSGIDWGSKARVYIDCIYFSTITITSIGYGDISPNTPQMKLFISLFAIIGQFYTVVLVGILISKFANIQSQNHNSEQQKNGN